MQRSASQVLFRFLPGAVFPHEDEFTARVDHVRGETVHDLNRAVLLEELGHELEAWQPNQQGLPDPARFPDEFVVIEPKFVSWDVYPLTFECTNPTCGRVKRWFRQDTLVSDTAAAGRLRCETCNSKMRQLRYLTAHKCGAMDPLFTPRCSNCNSTDHVYLEDLGSFRSSTWKCRNCGGFNQSTRFQRCDCGQYTTPGRATPYRTAYTTRDQHLWYPQTLTILNLASQTYDNLQRHANRGLAAVSSWLGDEENLSISVGQLDAPSTSTRFTEEEWADREQQMRDLGFDDVAIGAARAAQGPATSGVAATVGDLGAAALEHAGHRTFVERAGLYDRRIINDRITLDEIASDPGLDEVGRRVLERAVSTEHEFGISNISMTQQFPIVLASYGYTRCRREPGAAHLASYAHPRQYRGKTPIFAVPARTEALLVTVSALAIARFFANEGLWDGAEPADERTARVQLLELFTMNRDYGGADAAGVARRLVHTLSHALTRSLDDGETGFGESSMAEWIVPDALTTAIYVADYNDFTLGAFDTVLRRRVSSWLERAAHAVDRCDNDPLCTQQRPWASCDRCLHLSFGCRTWNADLDRKLLRRFWRWTRQQARARAA